VKGSANWALDSSYGYAKKACDESLRILGTDYIDLYYMHRANYETPIEETMKALAELKAEGKIKYIGLSEVSSKTLRRACAVAHVDAVQLEYSVFEREPEGPGGTHILRTARELGVAIVCYSPLGQGLLTGTLTQKGAVAKEGDMRAGFPRFAGENFDANVQLVNKFKAIADRKHITPGQLALAWLLKQGDDIIPIPGTKRIKYLEENWGTLDVDLTDAEVAEVRTLVETTDVSGARHVDAALSQCYADTREL
ncbi:NADP-dependent oxidoreductase domain-containing protein, partial [Astrocystis sublimbata]